MGLFDFFNSIRENNTIQTEQMDKESFLQSAEKAALIVSDSVERGKIGDVSKQLEKQIGKCAPRELAVFNCQSNVPWVIMLIASGIFSIFLMVWVPTAVRTVLYSSTYRLLGFIILGTVAGVVLFNAFLIKKAIKEIRFSKRYVHYQGILQYSNITIIEDLAALISEEKEVVIKDLEKAIKTKLIPQGHFGKDNSIFMVTDEAFAKYSEKQAEYDHYYEKLLQDRNRIKERTKETEELLSQGEEYVGKIQDYNQIITDSRVSEKLDRMEKVVSAIVYEADVNPAQASNLGMFINYYLPTTEKLLKAYVDIDEKNIKGKKLEKTQNEIIEALDSINNAFEHLLERFHSEQVMDVTSDIVAMETIMKQEGLQDEGNE